ncbi:MAG: GatB/YqeY domain-containing protein [Tissierellia bacterium]|nr:GatB/YqeY domain-containing protein [Tissierellia bacterium]
MSLKDRLMEDLKDSMKNKDTIKKNTITMVRAAIKQREVDERIELGDEDILDIISKQVKERNNAIEEFKKGDRQDLVDSTHEEIEILMSYLPEQLTEDEIGELVQETIEEVNAESMKDMGAVMQAIMPKVKGRADGKMVNQIVRQKLK